MLNRMQSTDLHATSSRMTDADLRNAVESADLLADNLWDAQPAQAWPCMLTTVLCEALDAPQMNIEPDTQFCYDNNLRCIWELEDMLCTSC